MVTTFYPPFHFGGDAIFIRRLSHALARRGHEVTVIHDADAWRMLAGRADPEIPEEPEGLTRVQLDSGSEWKGKLSCLLTQQAGRPVMHGDRIREVLDGGDFDVIFFHNISLVGGPGVLACGPDETIKLFMAHEHWLVCPSHVLWRHGRELCDGPECLRCVLHHRRPPQLWRQTGLLEREAKHVDVFYSPSSFSAGMHRQFGFPRELEVIPYFLPDLDAQVELPEPITDRPSDQPFFLFVGRLEKIKGLQDVIPRFEGTEGPELWVIGTGDYEKELHELAQGHPRVRFLGARSPEQLRSLYAEALAVVVPSVCYETFGIILLEAFREGTPVLARRLGPFTEIVEGSGGGLLFETDEELERGITRLAEDPDIRQELGAAGRKALEEKWTESVVLEQYFEMISRVAKEKNPALHRALNPSRIEPQSDGDIQ